VALEQEEQLDNDVWQLYDDHHDCHHDLDSPPNFDVCIATHRHVGTRGRRLCFCLVRVRG